MCTCAGAYSRRVVSASQRALVNRPEELIDDAKEHNPTIPANLRRQTEKKFLLEAGLRAQTPENKTHKKSTDLKKNFETGTWVSLSPSEIHLSFSPTTGGTCPAGVGYCDISSTSSGRWAAPCSRSGTSRRCRKTSCKAAANCAWSSAARDPRNSPPGSAT